MVVSLALQQRELVMNANCTMIAKHEIFGFKDLMACVSLLILMIVLNNIKMMWSVSSLVAFNFVL